MPINEDGADFIKLIVNGVEIKGSQKFSASFDARK